MLNKLSKLGLSIFSDWNAVIIEKRAQKQKHFFVHHRDIDKEEAIKKIIANIEVEGKEAAGFFPRRQRAAGRRAPATCVRRRGQVRRPL